MLDPRKYTDKLPKNENNIFKKQPRNDDFMSLFQDPTTLGFKLFFFNIGGATKDVGLKLKDLKSLFKKGASVKDRLDSAFKNVGTFVDTTPIINATGLFGNALNPNSALYYLDKMGDTARYDMLVDFIETLSKINSEYPWYFQSVSGLNEAWSRDYSKAKFKKEITIACLESIDLRMTALMDLYRKIAFDWKNRRAILPENLRQFEMSIKVYDMRRFKTKPNEILGVPTEFNSNNLKLNSAFLGEDYTNTTQITFNLGHCEFLPDESGAMLGDVSNVAYENAAQSIKISYSSIEEDNLYRILASLSTTKKYYKVNDYLKKEMSFLQSNEDPAKDLTFSPPGVQGIFGSLIDDITKNISSKAAGLVKNKLSSLFLGNVYGFSAANLIGNAQSLIADAPGRLINNLRSKKADKGSDALGSIFPPTSETPDPDDLGNIYPNIPETTDGGNLGSIYPPPSETPDPDDLGNIYEN